MSPSSPMSATAQAHPNIALAKYWGKKPGLANVPATPSLSLTLNAPFVTRTSVRFDALATEDHLLLNGVEASGRPLERVRRVLDELRQLAGSRAGAYVESRNDFPTASGLASSASGFAALVCAASAALGLQLDLAMQSRIARRASASAARSFFGGFVALPIDEADPAAVPVAPAEHWPLVVVVAAVNKSAKAVGSTEGMERCRLHSPYYQAWLEDAPRVDRNLRDAIERRDFELLGTMAEASALRMHACMMATAPTLLYWQPATLALLDAVFRLRARGTAAYATIDAGPHVKVLCTPDDEATVAAALSPHALEVRSSSLGPGASIVL